MIKYLIIENYKSIRHAELALAPINVLIGANGAGKSNFISFLQMVGRMYDQSLQRFVAENGGIENLLYGGQKTSSFVQGLIDFNNVNAYEFRLIPAQSSAIIEWEKDYFNGNKWDRQYERWHPVVFNKT
jgi:predicted ATPase